MIVAPVSIGETVGASYRPQDKDPEAKNDCWKSGQRFSVLPSEPTCSGRQRLFFDSESLF